jgi:hypothetical protein
VLPPWIANRLLRKDEVVTWVVGPHFNPSWERYITHPFLFLFALALGAVCVGGGRLIGGPAAMMAPILLAGGIVLGSIFVLGLSNGYFTRLVVTNARLVILQGYEVCSSWRIDALPRSLLRYRRQAGGVEEVPTVDLDALKTLLGGLSDKVAESKTILTFGKRLDQIMSREKGQP